MTKIDDFYDWENREELAGIICAVRHSWGPWNEVRFHGEGDGSGLYEPKMKRICNFCGAYSYQGENRTFSRFGINLNNGIKKRGVHLQDTKPGTVSRKH